MNEQTWNKNKEVVNVMREAIREDAKKEENSIGYKEFKALKKSNYDVNKNKYSMTYVLQHKKTKAIVEIKAVSELSAVKTIGWRPRHTILLEKIEDEKKEDNLVDENKSTEGDAG